jgi:hypothetical protein
VKYFDVPRVRLSVESLLPLGMSAPRLERRSLLSSRKGSPQASESGYPSKRRNTRRALCPPKPNELETAIRTSPSCASFGGGKESSR